MDKYLDCETINIKRSRQFAMIYILSALVIFLLTCPLLIYGKIFPFIFIVLCCIIVFIAGVLSATDRRTLIILNTLYVDIIGVVQIPLNQIKSVEYEVHAHGFIWMIFQLKNEKSKPIKVQLQHLDISPSQLQELILIRLKNLNNLE